MTNEKLQVYNYLMENYPHPVYDALYNIYTGNYVEIDLKRISQYILGVI